MKIIKILGVALMVTIFFSSCDKWVDEDINIDPNAAQDVLVTQMLANAQASYGWLQGSDINRFSSIFIQQHAGVERQHAGIDVYNIKENDVVNSWSNIYEDVLVELHLMISKAEAETPSPYYSGVAKTMTAMVLMQMTDLYGAIPYRTALQGGDNLSPSFDSQESIYTDILVLLDESLIDFDEGVLANVFVPGSDDLIYGGDISKWIELANTLKARAYLHLGARSDDNYESALSALDDGSLSSIASDAQVNFVATATGENPLSQFMDDRGDIRMGEFFVDLLVSENDPRIQPFAGDTLLGGIYLGSPAGVPTGGVNAPGPFFASPASPVFLLTYAERLFIEAEAAFQTGDADRAATAHNMAVTQSLMTYGVSDPTFLVEHAEFDAGDITLEEIMTQKYIHLYTQAEAYTDWRRTGIPELTPAIGAESPGGEIPIRWPYSQDERLYNASFPGQQSLNSPLWWDVD